MCFQCVTGHLGLRQNPGRRTYSKARGGGGGGQWPSLLLGPGRRGHRQALLPAGPARGGGASVLPCHRGCVPRTPTRLFHVVWNVVSETTQKRLSTTGGTLGRPAVCPPLEGARVGGLMSSSRKPGPQAQLGGVPGLWAGCHPAWPPAPRGIPLPRAPASHAAPRTVVGPISPSSQPQPLWPGLARARGLSGGHGDPVWLSDRGPCSWAGAQFKGAPAVSACSVASEAPPSTPSAFGSLRSPSGRVHTPPRRAEVSAVQAPGTACPCAAEVNPHPEQSRHDL